MGYYKIISHEGTGYPLNLEAVGPISGIKNVGIWEESCPIDQIWSVATLGNNQEIKTINNLSYMINANTNTWNCNVNTKNEDTSVNFEKVSTGIYYIRLKSNLSKYLTADGTKSGSNVSWAGLSTTTAGKKAQKWKMISVQLPTVYTRVEEGYDTLGDTQMEVNARYIYNYLSKKSFTKKAICGILGNMESESTINPAVWQKMNNTDLGYGLVQWSSGQAQTFLDWAKKEGIITRANPDNINALAYSNPAKLMDAELEFLIVSMNTAGNWYKPADNQSKYGTTATLTAKQYPKATEEDVGTLARILCGHYERPNKPNMTERVNNAEKWYKFL